MRLKNILIALILCMSFFLQYTVALAVFEKIDGLEYGVRKIEDVPIQRVITRNYDLYELYFENKSDKTFSIPGYSIDLGVDYSNLAEINSLFSGKSQKKLAVFNIAAGAASIALGGLARTAANSAMRTIGSFRRKNSGFDDNSSYLSANKTYILYPGDGLSLFLFVNKSLVQIPNTIRFVCRQEDSNVNYVVINNSLDLREKDDEINLGSNEENCPLDKAKENIIAAPTIEQYK